MGSEGRGNAVYRDIRIASCVLAIGAVARLPDPVAGEVGKVEIGRQHRTAGELDVVCGRRAVAFGLEAVVAERVVARAEAAELGLGQARVGELRVFLVVVAAERDGLTLADLSDPLEVEVVDLVVHVLPRAVALLTRVVEQKTVAADIHLAVEIVAVADRALDVSAQALRRVGRDVVDDAADGLRAELQGIGALQHLDAVETVDGRVVVAGVVAVGRISDRDAVFEQRDLGRTCRVEAADADVRPQAKALLVADIHARHFAQRFGSGEHF